jgi:NAD(P)-dependent dehydrogenase (short-subunit alcohol dehydrogenase family)
MHFESAGKWAVITGASRGLENACAQAFAQHDWNVWIVLAMNVD